MTPDESRRIWEAQVESRRIWEAQGYIDDDKVEDHTMSKHRAACPPQRSHDLYVSNNVESVVYAEGSTEGRPPCVDEDRPGHNITTCNKATPCSKPTLPWHFGKDNTSTGTMEWAKNNVRFLNCMGGG